MFTLATSLRLLTRVLLDKFTEERAASCSHHISRLSIQTGFTQRAFAAFSQSLKNASRLNRSGPSLLRER